MEGAAPLSDDLSVILETGNVAHFPVLKRFHRLVNERHALGSTAGEEPLVHLPCVETPVRTVEPLHIARFRRFARRGEPLLGGRCACGERPLRRRG